MSEQKPLAPATDLARCQVTCGEYPSYYKCDRPAKYVTDGSKPPGALYVCGIHARGRRVTALNHKLGPSDAGGTKP